MSMYNLPSQDMVLNAINIENGLVTDPLTLKKIAMGLPQTITSPESRQDTRLIIYGIKDGGYQGAVTINYKRLDLAVLFRNMTPVVITDPVTKLSDLLTQLNMQYGLSLTADDIVEQDVSQLGDSWVLSVIIKPTSYAWQGTFDLRFSKYLPEIGSEITDSVLDVINAPYDITSKPRAEYLTYGYDYSEAAAMLSAASVGAALPQSLIDTLNQTAPVQFSLLSGSNVPAGTVSLLGATISGRVATTANEIYDSSYDQVVVVLLGSDSNYTGHLYLHYNLDN